jgi:hypothetical protein
MTTVTITANIALTLEGRAFNTGGTYSADVLNVVEQTRDFDNSYSGLQYAGTNGFSFVFLVNIGDEPALITLAGATFGIGPGQHMLISGTCGSQVSSTTTLNTTVTSALEARAVSGTTRLYSVIGY